VAAVVNINDLEVYTFDRSKCGDEFVVSLNDDLFFVVAGDDYGNEHL